MTVDSKALSSSCDTGHREYRSRPRGMRMLYYVVLRTPYARGQLQGIGSLVSAKNVESGIGRDVARKGTKKRKKAKAGSWIKG
jgi:hypothetical protein